jgi:hypothetical protein
MSVTNNGGTVTATADLTDIYASNNDAVHSWTRALQYSGDTLRVTDVCSVANGVQPVFQLQVPVQPVLQQDGSVIAGSLHIVPLQGVNPPTFTQMDAAEFSRGFRIDFTSTAGCSFDFQLQAQ